MTVAPPAITVTEHMPVSVSITRAEEAAQPVHSEDLSLVFSAGNATYMKLADDLVPKHGRARLVRSEHVEHAIANVEPVDVPTTHRDWLGKRVLVDNTCETRVIGFEVVSRLTGDTGYADVSDDRWTASNVLDKGSVVLAARLAGCSGTFARDAALPRVVDLREVRNDKLAARARALLIASDAGRAAQREWNELDQPGVWQDDEAVQFHTKVLEHPTTGVTWVSVHGTSEQSCGNPDINVWGLFRVQADGNLAPVELRKLEDVWSIDRLFDIDNDGELELIGQPWLGLDIVVARASGEELQRLSLPFYGCPC